MMFNKLLLTVCGLSVFLGSNLQAADVAQKAAMPKQLMVTLENGKHVFFVPRDSKVNTEESALWITGRIGARIVRFAAIAGLPLLGLYCRVLNKNNVSEEEIGFFRDLFGFVVKEGAELGAFCSIPDVCRLVGKGYKFARSKWQGKTADKNSVQAPEAQVVKQTA